MTTRSVVVGAGGLLGRAVARAASVDGEVVRPRIDWSSSRAALSGLLSAVETASLDGAPDVYWCAGAGVTSTPRATLAAEAELFREFVECAVAGSTPRSLFLASSVGGVWAGSRDAPFSEERPPAPASAYGETKLAMESIAREASSSSTMRTFIARISNLYGPDQNLGKGQGLLSVIARAAVTNRPIPLYVSLDTIRDYIHAADAASLIVAGTRRAAESSSPSTTKIVASGVGTTIAGVLSEFRRVTHRRLLVVSSARSAAGQAPDLRVRSTVWTDLDGRTERTLAEGIDELIRYAMLSAHTTGWGV